MEDITKDTSAFCSGVDGKVNSVGIDYQSWERRRFGNCGLGIGVGDKLPHRLGDEMLRSLFGLVKQTFQEYSDDRVPQLAAAIAYYTIFSLAPLLVIVVSIAGYVFDQEQARQAILGEMRVLVGREGAAFIRQLMQAAGQDRAAGTVASLVGVGAMLFGATGAFVALHDALNRIWGAEPLQIHGVLDFIRKRFLSFTLVLGAGFLLLVSLVVNTALAALADLIRSHMPGSDILLFSVHWAIAFGLITILFAMIFKILPDVQIRWRDVWVGAAVTALLFNLGKEAIGIYLGNSAVGSAYGAAGALVLLLLWIYYSTQVLLIGAEFTQVYARRYGAPFLPVKHGREEREASGGESTTSTAETPATETGHKKATEA